MFIQCPKCLFSDQVEESKIPEKGGYAKCPKCGHRFLVKRAHDAKPAIDRFSEATMVMTPGKQKAIPQSAYRAQTVNDKTAMPSIHKLSFHGYGGTLFGIQLVNVLLTIATVGIYHFWGKTNVRKYLYSQAELMGERFAYHGTGKELFIGWLKAIALIIIGYAVIIGLATYIHPFFFMLIYPALLVAVPFAMVGAMRYRLSRTSWHGVRFSFRGSFMRAIRLYAGGLLLTIITLAFYFPFFHTQMRSFWLNESYFGNVPFHYNGRGRDLMGSHVLAIFLSIITLGLYWFWYKAKIQRYDWEHTAFSTVRFKSTVTGSSLFVLSLTNFLLILFTLGIVFPWVIIRTLRFRFDYLFLEGDVELDKIKQDAQSAKAVGESLADFMNIDSGLI